MDLISTFIRQTPLSLSPKEAVGGFSYQDLPVTQPQVPWELVPALSHCSLKFRKKKKPDLNTTVAAALFLHCICYSESPRAAAAQKLQAEVLSQAFLWTESVQPSQHRDLVGGQERKPGRESYLIHKCCRRASRSPQAPLQPGQKRSSDQCVTPLTITSCTTALTSGVGGVHGGFPAAI